MRGAKDTEKEKTYFFSLQRVSYFLQVSYGVSIKLEW